MINVVSYLRAQDGQFLEAGEVTIRPVEPRFVEGAVKLTVDGVEIIDITMWDYVDQLWAYISDMIFAFRENDEVSTYFPDQPTKLSFRRIGGGNVLVSVELNNTSRTAVAREDELLGAMRSAGSEFFAKLIELLPENRGGYEDALGRLTRR